MITKRQIYSFYLFKQYFTTTLQQYNDTLINYFYGTRAHLCILSVLKIEYYYLNYLPTSHSLYSSSQELCRSCILIYIHIYNARTYVQITHQRVYIYIVHFRNYMIKCIGTDIQHTLMQHTSKLCKVYRYWHTHYNHVFVRIHIPRIIILWVFRIMQSTRVLTHAGHPKNQPNVLECRLFGLFMFWSVDISVSRRCFGDAGDDVSVCRRFGLLTFRFIDVSVCGRFSLSADILLCHHFGCQRFGLSTFCSVHLRKHFSVFYIGIATDC